ncbi:MAG: response regulator [Mariprofundaceae bacterium]|nr:response regulator [Mariprofundaceae bacterium]
MLDQQYMDNIFEHSSDAIILVDVKENIVRVNPACASLLGYKSTELQHAPLSNIISENTLHLHLGHRIEHQHQPYHSNGDFIHHNGHAIQAKFISQTWFIDDKPAGSLFMLQAEQNNLQHKLEKSQRLESLGTLAGGITHDLNNVLSIATGNVMLSKQHIYRPEKMKIYLGRIEDSCKRASNLCRQILAYSGMDRYTMTKTSPSQLVDSMQDMLSALRKHNNEIEYDLDEELPEIKVDTLQLQQVIINLVNNAYEAVPPGTKPHIVVRTGQLEVTPQYFADAFGTRHSLSGQFTWVEVSDNGVGMDSGVRSRIFEPFFSTKHESRGLGMTATLGIVRGHNGAIKIWSEPNQGTTIRILLPTAQAGNEDVATPVIGNTHQTLPSTLSGAVLVVDDEEDIREMLRLNLEGMGCKVLEAADGEEGLRMYKKHQNDISVILLDMAMPNMDGAEMMESLENIAQYARIIVISGYSEKIVQGRFSNFKPDAFLYKPFEISELQSCLQSIFQEAA